MKFLLEKIDWRVEQDIKRFRSLRLNKKQIKEKLVQLKIARETSRELRNIKCE